MTSIVTVFVEGEPPNQLVWDRRARISCDALLKLDERRKQGTAIEVICPCGHQLVLRIRHRSSSTRFPHAALASWPDDNHEGVECLCSHRRKSPLMDLKGLLSPAAAFADRSDSFADWRVKLSPVHDSLAATAKRLTSRHRLSKTVTPSAATYRTLGGIFDALAETARLCSYWPERTHGQDVASALRHIKQQCLDSEKLTEAFLNRTVFYRQGHLADDLAAAEQKRATALGEHVLLIFTANFSHHSAGGAWSSPHENLELTHSATVTARLAKPGAKRLAEFVRQNSDAALVVTALIRRYDAGYIVDDCAWRLVDRFGIIYETPAEFRAGRQLVAARISFAKPARTLFRIGGHRHIPDFILFGAESAPFVLEVDPSAGRRTTKRKMRRDRHYSESGLKFAKWHGKETDLVLVLQQAGFRRKEA